jgi:hypothetical protein
LSVKERPTPSVKLGQNGSTACGVHVTTEFRGYPSGKEDTKLYLKKQEEVVTKNNHNGWMEYLASGQLIDRSF